MRKANSLILLASEKKSESLLLRHCFLCVRQMKALPILIGGAFFLCLSQKNQTTYTDKQAAKSAAGLPCFKAEASVPDLPGAVTMGSSSLRTRKPIKEEAAQGWMESMHDLDSISLFLCAPLCRSGLHGSFLGAHTFAQRALHHPNSVTPNSFTCCKASAKALQHAHAQRRLSSL